MKIVYKQYTVEMTSDIIKLQQTWVDENITYGFGADTVEEIQTHNRDYFYSAFDGVKAIAYVTAEVIYNLDNEYINIFPQGTKFIRVNDLYVLPEYRSNQIGENLLETVEERAKANGISAFFISSATNDAASVRRFYEKNGYLIWTTLFYKK